MRIARISPCAVAMFCLTLAPAYAQQGKGGGAAALHGNPHTTTAAKAPTTTTHGPSATTHGPKSTTHGQTTHGGPKTTTATTGTATSTTTRLNPIAQKLQGKPLGARIEKMLPANMTLNTASAGFRNQGQFIAAVHVSQNLGIPFADLRAAMLGLPPSGSTTTPRTALTALSLGQAIQKLRPQANATTEASHAETQARADLSTTTSKKKSH